VRPDKLALAALAATLQAWKTGAWRTFPIYRAASASVEDLEGRGRSLLERVPKSKTLSVALVPSLAAFGGGTSPERLFPSRALAVESAERSADALAALLREGSPPIVARVERGKVLLDLRSVSREEDALVAAALASVAADSAATSRV
jgi:L-seryl-tRNA(Ser) seleniumtransferase